MAKVVLKRLKAGRFTGPATRSVGKKRVLKADGGWKTVRTLDANSAIFEEGLRYVFTKNVAKARRDNKRVVGASDIAPPSVDRPIFWIVAGPNGSGKSTTYEDVDIEAVARSVWIINPDVLTARISEGGGSAPSGRQS